MRRTTMSPGRLYALLSAQYKALRSPQCGLCRMPLPYLTARPDEVSANWRIGTPPECEHGCHVLITEIAAAAWPAYDLEDLTSVAADSPPEPKQKQPSEEGN